MIMSLEEVGLENIRFDESDRNLFQVDDARLRADALRHSILPRLHVLMNQCLAIIRDVYRIEALNDSRVSFYPQFRTKRKIELSHLYDFAYVGLGGYSRKKGWTGVQRKDTKPVQLLPFRYGLQIGEKGLAIYLENHWVKGLTAASHKKFFDFHLEFESLIHVLCHVSKITPFLAYGDEVAPISTFRKHYEFMLQNQIFNNDFGSEFKGFPLTSNSLNNYILQFVYFYPVYDSYLQIAMGTPVRFEKLVGKLNEWIREQDKSDDWGDTENKLPALSDNERMGVREIAEQRVKVMPSIRWQVFQRDNWKCVACGRGAQDGIILQVDHIIPRSKRGKDTLDNFQTLCHICNLGKSNKDSTNLRAT